MRSQTQSKFNVALGGCKRKKKNATIIRLETEIRTKDTNTEYIFQETKGSS